MNPKDITPYIIIGGVTLLTVFSFGIVDTGGGCGNGDSVYVNTRDLQEESGQSAHYDAISPDEETVALDTGQDLAGTLIEDSPTYMMGFTSEQKAFYDELTASRRALVRPSRDQRFTRRDFETIGRDLVTLKTHVARFSMFPGSVRKSIARSGMVKNGTKRGSIGGEMAPSSEAALFVGATQDLDLSRDIAQYSTYLLRVSWGQDPFNPKLAGSPKRYSGRLSFGETAECAISEVQLVTVETYVPDDYGVQDTFSVCDDTGCESVNFGVNPVQGTRMEWTSYVSGDQDGFWVKFRCADVDPEIDKARIEFWGDLEPSIHVVQLGQVGNDLAGIAPYQDTDIALETHYSVVDSNYSVVDRCDIYAIQLHSRSLDSGWMSADIVTEAAEDAGVVLGTFFGTWRNSKKTDYSLGGLGGFSAIDLSDGEGTYLGILTPTVIQTNCRIQSGAECSDPGQTQLAIGAFSRWDGAQVEDRYINTGVTWAPSPYDETCWLPTGVILGVVDIDPAKTHHTLATGLNYFQLIYDLTDESVATQLKRFCEALGPEDVVFDMTQMTPGAGTLPMEGFKWPDFANFIQKTFPVDIGR